MCLLAWLATPTAVPCIDWDQSRPAFWVGEAEPDDPVRARFSLPKVYLVGSHTKCGCGFKYGLESPDEVDHEEEASGRASVDALRAYVTAAAAGQPVELFACWAGDEALPALAEAAITPDQLGGAAFELQERHLLRVGRAGGAPDARHPG